MAELTKTLKKVLVNFCSSLNTKHFVVSYFSSIFIISQILFYFEIIVSLSSYKYFKIQSSRKTEFTVA